MTPKLADEILMAYADGALGPEEAAAVEATLALDPEAAATAARFRASGALVRAAFDETLTEPVPLVLERQVRAAARHRLVHRRRSRRELVLAASVALLLGLGGGAWLARSGGDGTLPGLAAALATTPSGVRTVLPDGGTLAPIATFRDREGRWCRTFTQIVDGQPGEGAACRDADNGWRLVFLVSDQPTDGRDYAPAGAEPSLAESLRDQLQTGDPLNEAQERDLIDRDWR